MSSLILALIACLESSATSWLYQYIKCKGGGACGTIVNNMTSTHSWFWPSYREFDQTETSPKWKTLNLFIPEYEFLYNYHFLALPVHQVCVWGGAHVGLVNCKQYGFYSRLILTFISLIRPRPVLSERLWTYVCLWVWVLLGITRSVEKYQRKWSQ